MSVGSCRIFRTQHVRLNVLSVCKEQQVLDHLHAPTDYVPSKIDHARVVLEELAPILCDLRGDAARILDSPLSEIVQDPAETVVPQLFFVARFAWVRCTQLYKQFFAYKVCSSQSAHEGRGVSR